MSEIAALVSEFRECEAFYFDRPSVPIAEYPSLREISVTETRALCNLLQRAAAELNHQARP